MAKVWLMLYADRGAVVETKRAEFARVPVAGEHFALVEDQRHFVVNQVLHVVGGDRDAEVWAWQLTDKQVEKFMGTGPWKKGPVPQVF